MVYQTTGDGVRSVLASNLRRLRVAHRLSLSELARAAAMSKATLSGMERGRANPTVDTLSALAGALGVSTAELLERPPVEEMRIVRAAQAEPLGDDGLRSRGLDSVAVDGRIDLFELVLAPRCVHAVEPAARSSRSHVLVLEGRLIAGPVERISELVAGDYASFPADVAHVYEAGGAGARALVLRYAPR